MNFNTYNTQNNIYINDILLSYKNKDNQPFIAASIFSFFFMNLLCLFWEHVKSGIFLYFDIIF